MDDDAPCGDETDASAAGGWIPARSLSVGVTGHRLERLGADRVHAVEAAAGEVLAALAGSAPEGGAAFRLVTAVADGADSIFGEAALAAGWRLDVVLPFGRDHYAADFPEGPARAAYERLLTSSGAVFELHESDPDEGGVAYERAGRVVLSQSDILVAVWDNGPVRGRGGAAQIVAEAVLQGIPVIQIDPSGGHPPSLLWDGLIEHDLGQQTVDTVPRGGLDALPRLVGGLLDPPAGADEQAMLASFEGGVPGRRLPAIAWPLLLAAMGVRRPRRSDFLDRAERPSSALGDLCRSARAGAFGARIQALLAPRFARADSAANQFAQLFRSGYVTNFILAALAVLLSLLGLALPSSLKPVLIVLEAVTIGTILVLTRVGRRGGWHRRWLDSRHLAERLRCLAVSAQLGELGLRNGAGGKVGWVGWYVRATARELALPSVRVDSSYLACCRDSLTALIDDQVAYLEADAHRMRRLEHRLHRLGTTLFAMTALTCLGLFLFEIAYQAKLSASLTHVAKPLVTAATIASAALPAMGAAIYGIRMQGDFAGSAERSEALRRHLESLRRVMASDALDFDTLRRRVRRATDLLTEGLGSWLQTYHARPLTLPG